MPGELGWYRELLIQFSDGSRATFEIERRLTGTHIPQVRNPAEWTRLGFRKCPCCPLPGDLGWCPAALSLQATVDKLRHRTSVEMVTATATDAQGHSETTTAPLQAVGAVLVQLAVFASECPVGRKVKPYLAGLSPFIGSNELIQKLLERILAAEGDVEALIKPLHEVFVYLLSRLSGMSSKAHEDAIPNSVVRVDAIAQALAFRARRLNDGMSEQLGWTARKRLEKPSLLDKFRGLFGA